MIKPKLKLCQGRVAHRCDLCGGKIKALKKYYRVQGGVRWQGVKVMCKKCHALIGLSTEPWKKSQDGKRILPGDPP